jgi:hypothetical protein
VLLSMSTRRFAYALSIAAACWSCSATSAPDVAAAGEDPVVATVDGREVTVSELDDWIRADLFEKETGGNASKLYELRVASMERMAAELIAEKQAAAQQLSEEDFLQSEIDAIGEVSEEEIVAFYEENKSPTHPPRRPREVDAADSPVPREGSAQSGNGQAKRKRRGHDRSRAAAHHGRDHRAEPRLQRRPDYDRRVQ